MNSIKSCVCVCVCERKMWSGFFFIHSLVSRFNIFFYDDDEMADTHTHTFSLCSVWICYGMKSLDVEFLNFELNRLKISMCVCVGSIIIDLACWMRNYSVWLVGRFFFVGHHHQHHNQMIITIVKNWIDFHRSEIVFFVVCLWVYNRWNGCVFDCASILIYRWCFIYKNVCVCVLCLYYQSKSIDRIDRLYSIYNKKMVFVFDMHHNHHHYYYILS